MSASGTGLPEMPPAEAVRSGGVTLRVRRLGAGRSAHGRRFRIVALHGGPGLDHHLLLPLGLALSESFEVWLPDLPGHGGSHPPHAALPGLRTVEERVGRWLRGLDGGTDVLLGHSLGAWLVRELLRPAGAGARSGRPSGVRAAVLLSPPASGQRRAATALRRAGALVGRSKGEPGRREARARREVRAHVEAEAQVPLPGLFLDALAHARLRDPRHFAALNGELHRRLVAPSRAFDPGCPVLVLCGEEDRTTPPGQAAQVAASLENARLELIPESGHYPQADALEATARAVRRFLEAVLGR